jgi:hypothetical protein
LPETAFVAAVDRLLLKTMANGSQHAQISAAKAAFLCQRVEDNAFQLQQYACALRIRVIRGIRGFLNVNLFVFIRVYSPGAP